MLPLSFPTRWRLAGIILLFAVLGVAMAPELWPWLSGGGTRLPNDKLMHGVTFAFLAIWYSGQYPRRSYWLLILGLFVFGAFIEVCQSFVTYRTAEAADLAADALGVLVGIAIALAGLGGWSMRFESWISRRG